jgi:hypothetical protein
LQPSYRSLALSDCVVINTGQEADGSVLADCVRLLGALLSRIREGTGKERQLFICDPSDAQDPGTAKLMARLKELLSTGR